MSLLAAPTSAARAQELASKKAWEELYLAFSAVEPSKVPFKEKKAIAAQLHKGCEALGDTDAVMAYSLGERSVAFDPSPEGILCLARAAVKSEQRGAAEEALIRGLRRHPKNAALALALGRLQVDDGDAQAAVATLSRVNQKAKEYPEAHVLLKQARAAAREKDEAVHRARALENTVLKSQAATSGRTPGSLTYESGVEAGLRTRANSRFRFKYFNGQRDFGQRAEYEGKVAAALEVAYNETQRILGETRASQVDVILYSREEFATHFGGTTSMSIAGFYSEGAIRMNDSAEVNSRNTSTLVHEYVHAAIDDFCGGRAMRVPVWMNEGLAEYVQWRHEGREVPTLGLAAEVRAVARGNSLPTLAQMGVGRRLVDQPNPHLLYAVSALAVRQLVLAGGTGKLLELIRELGRGEPFEQAFERKYGRTVTQFEEELRRELRQR